MTPSQPQTSITFPTVEAALSALAKPVLGADLVVIEATTPAAPRVPDGLPPIPDGYVYIGEDTGGIVTGEITEEGQLDTIRWWHPNNNVGWRREGIVSGCSHNWHAIAPVGSVLAQLNGHPLPAATLPPHREWTAWENACRQKDADIDKLLAERESLHAETQRLHAEWHAAAADANTQREEVKWLAQMREKDNADLFAYGEFTRGVATALGMSTHSISFTAVLERVEEAHSSRGQVEFHHNAWRGACAELERVTAERNALHARVEEMEAWAAWKPTPRPEPQYRMLEVGEKIQPGDECLSQGVWIATTNRVHGITIKDLGSTEAMGNYGFYRRLVTPEPRYRMLEEGEQIRITDEYQGSQGWHPRASVRPDEVLRTKGSDAYHAPHRRIAP